MNVAWAPGPVAVANRRDKYDELIESCGIFEEATRLADGAGRGEPLTIAQARAALREFA